MKPEGYIWSDAGGYELAILSSDGSTRRIYRDKKYSAFQPVPVAPRPMPPVLPSAPDEDLERRNLAALLITDVYAGTDNIPRGAAKYVRVLDQIARPWGANRIAMGGEKTEDAHGQQHAVISRYTHLGVKVQLGVAEIEPDGSAYFLVPANRNIFLQILDKNYMALQTERTFVNYMPGEIRGCIGCHERASETPRTAKFSRVLALCKPPQELKPQKGENPPKSFLTIPRKYSRFLTKNACRAMGKTGARRALTCVGPRQSFSMYRTNPSFPTM